jgi:hypothetical protein
LIEERKRKANPINLLAGLRIKNGMKFKEEAIQVKWENSIEEA